MLIEALKGRKDWSVIHPPNKLGSLLTEVDKKNIGLLGLKKIRG